VGYAHVFQNLKTLNTMAKLNKKWSIARVVGRYTFTVSKSYGVSDGGYYHMPILFFGFGSNGFGITLLGIYFGLAW
jgi:hypothetical protein